MVRLSLPWASFLLAWLACVNASLAKDPVQFRPGRVIPPAGEGQNLIPNASFECGAYGWGSTEREVLPGWYGTLNGLFGRLDPTTAADGRVSLKIELTPENQPVAYNDYLHTQRWPITAPLAANVGWIAVKPGRKYTFSAAMKAAQPDTPARLVVRQFRAAPFDKLIKLTTDWQRYQLDFTPTAETCYVLAGPDLGPSKDNPHPPRRATVWLDAVQLAAADAKPGFATREPVELGLATGKPGNIFAWDEPLQIRLTVASTDPQERKLEIGLLLTDFFGEGVWHDTKSVTVPAGSSQELTVTIPPAPQLRGYLRLQAGFGGARSADGRSLEAQGLRYLRLASTPVYSHADSRFGMNHAFGWPEMLNLARRAGLLWMRDWSMKWQDVEPVKGQFTFAETDAQVDRILRQDLKVLEVLPFPSSMWSTSAAESVPKNDPWNLTFSNAPDPQTQYDEILAESGSRIRRMGYAPREMTDFENYVNRTVAHCKGRIHDWQVFNEPLRTSYALPKSAGYGAADYLRYVESFVRAARRADPDCRIFGGFNLGGPSDQLAEPLQFIKLGGLKHIDILTLHCYPGRTPPEYIERILVAVRKAMDEQNLHRPIWFTEFAYYADDETWIEPFNEFIHFSGAGAGYHQPSERVQAEYQVRIAVTMFAHGVDKLFFHAGTGSAINHGNLWTMFLRYGSEPFKNYASQAVMAHLLTPDCKFVKRLLPDEPLRAYLFSDAKRTVGVIWTAAGEKPRPVQLASPKLQVWDLMGRPQALKTFTPSETPAYIVGENVSPEDFEKAFVAAPSAQP